MLWGIVCLILILAVLMVFLVKPGPRRAALRFPFEGVNFAHRGYYAKNQRPPENSLPAFAAAVEAGYGIELDVQFTADRRLIVFHDDTLDRMTGVHGWVSDHPWAEVGGLALAGSGEHPPLFADVLAAVGGWVPLIVEIKSRPAYNGKYLDALCRATLDALNGYPGAYCIESFDPRVVARVRKLAPGVLRGQLADSYRSYRRDGTKAIPAFVLSHCLGNFLGRPDFIAWCPDPENWAVRLCRRFGAMMVMWTALPEHDHKALGQRYDGVIFQWYAPEKKNK